MNNQSIIVNCQYCKQKAIGYRDVFLCPSCAGEQRKNEESDAESEEESSEEESSEEDAGRLWEHVCNWCIADNPYLSMAFMESTHDKYSCSYSSVKECRYCHETRLGRTISIDTMIDEEVRRGRRHPPRYECS